MYQFSDYRNLIIKNPDTCTWEQLFDFEDLIISDVKYEDKDVINLFYLLIFSKIIVKNIFQKIRLETNSRLVLDLIDLIIVEPPHDSS